MTISDAYDYLDLLLDKANQPWFSDTEKDIFGYTTYEEGKKFIKTKKKKPANSDWMSELLN